MEQVIENYRKNCFIQVEKFDKIVILNYN